MAAEIPEVSLRARRRIAWRILPYVFLLYIIAYLDRVNVGFATLEMSKALGFSDDVFGFGAGVFFIGYFVLEIPGAVIVERWSARRWLARIMITWGMITIAMAFLQNKGQFYGARFLLGAAEAGFFPGLIVYLTHWFRYEDRAKAVAMLMSAIPLSNVIGSPIAGVLLGVHWLGIEGWRWLFIVEGIPAVIFGVVTLAYLTDLPQQARWLRDDERDWIVQELAAEAQAKRAVRHYTWWEALRQRDVLLLALLYFFAVSGNYGYNLWLPTILKRNFGLPNLTVTLLAALPAGAGFICMTINAWHSDRTGERRWHTALPLFLASFSMGMAILFGSSLWGTVALFTIYAGFLNSYLAPFWSLPTITLGGTAAAASIGLINSVGNLGGFAGPYAMGYLRERTHSFSAGLFYLLTGMFIAGCLTLCLRVYKKSA